MKIFRIGAESFGKFSKIEIALKDGINVIYGNNESGKSTIREMVKVLLFGFGSKVKSSKKYDFYPWTSGENAAYLKLECEGLLDDATPFTVTRTLSSTVTGRTSVGHEIVDIGNECIPVISHLNEKLYSDVYSLSTENTYDFQNIDIEQFERRISETWGSRIIKTPAEVLSSLNDEISIIYKQKYNSSTKLRKLSNELSESQAQRSGLIGRRDEYSETLKRIEECEYGIEKQKEVIASKKRDMKKLEAFMPAFMEMLRSKNDFGETVFDDIAGFDVNRAVKMLDVANAIKDVDAQIKKNDQLAENALDNIYSVWSSLFKSFPQEELFEKASAMNFSESIMVAGEGRKLKMQIAIYGKIRIISGLLMSAIGLFATLSFFTFPDYRQMANESIYGFLFGGLFIVSLFSLVTTVDVISKNISHRVLLKKIKMQIYECLEDFLPPSKAVETFDEEWFAKLSDVENLSRMLVSLKNKIRNDNLRKDALLSKLKKMSGKCNLESKFDTVEIIEELQLYIARDQRLAKKNKDLSIIVQKAQESTDVSMREIKAMISQKYMSSDPAVAFETVRTQLENAAGKLSEHNIELAGLKASIDGDDTYDKILVVESRIKDIRDKIKTLKSERDRLLILSEFISIADEKYIEGKKPDFAKRASEIFSSITDDVYSYIEPENGKMFVRGTHRVEHSKISSTATREQLFMSIKTAVLSCMEEKYESLPVSFDEVFASWDKNRFGRFVKVLKHESKGRQILVYTCDEAVLNSLREDCDVNVITLEE